MYKDLPGKIAHRQLCDAYDYEVARQRRDDANIYTAFNQEVAAMNSAKTRDLLFWLISPTEDLN